MKRKASQIHTGKYRFTQASTHKYKQHTALIKEGEVSIVASRVSPILMDTICAPGATPFRSGVSGKLAAAIDAT